MRAVIDTNVLLSGLLWSGTPRDLIDALGAGDLRLISSPHLIAELARVLVSPKLSPIVERARLDPAALVARVRQLAELHDPAPLARPVCRDPDDDAVLALALHARAACIISGDLDMLTLQSFSSIPILTPRQPLIASPPRRGSMVQPNLVGHVSWQRRQYAGLRTVTHRVTVDSHSDGPPTDMHNPPHPGEILREMYFLPLDLTVTSAAEGLGVSRKALSKLLNGHSDISRDMTIRLAKAFPATGIRFWLDLQLQYDAWQAEKRAPAIQVTPFTA